MVCLPHSMSVGARGFWLWNWWQCYSIQGEGVVPRQHGLLQLGRTLKKEIVVIFPLRKWICKIKSLFLLREASTQTDAHPLGLQ